VYGCETWSVTIREESRPSVFENGVMCKLFVSELEEVTGDCIKQHNESVRGWYCSSVNLIFT
jgi:hypothetical protein